MARKPGPGNLGGPLALAYDIGESHLKAAVLSPSGSIATGPVRVATPHPAKPDDVLEALIGPSNRLGAFDRVSIGFPGVVRGDTVLTAPNLGTADRHGFPLAGAIAESLASRHGC